MVILKKNTFRVLFVVFIWMFLFSCEVFAKGTRMRCNVNSECRPGFVCVGGIGDAAGTTELTGCCEVILPLRQVCIFHNLLTGKLGKGIVALVIISIGLATAFGKLGMRSLLTFFVGTVCIFGSYQVVNLLTGYNYQVCELVDTSITPGNCSENIEEENLVNADLGSIVYKYVYD